MAQTMTPIARPLATATPISARSWMPAATTIEPQPMNDERDLRR